MTSSTIASEKNSRGVWPVAILCLFVASPSMLADAAESFAIGTVQIELTNARAIKCKRFEKVKEGVGDSFDRCFSARASASPELILKAEDEALLSSVVMTTTALDGSKERSMTTDKRPAGRTEFTKKLPIPWAPMGRRASPDAPLVKPGASSLFKQSRAGSQLRPGLYRTEVVAGHGQDAQRFVLGVRIEAFDGANKTSQWNIVEGKASLVVPGCFKEQPDPVVELFLEDCEDPRYKVKAVAPTRQAGVTLANYVDHSLAAYKKIWSLQSRTDSSIEPKHIKLELQQVLAGQQDFLLKYFVELGDRVLVVTFYGPVDEQRKLRRRYGKLADWLAVSAASESP